MSVKGINGGGENSPYLLSPSADIFLRGRPCGRAHTYIRLQDAQRKLFIATDRRHLTEVRPHAAVIGQCHFF